MSKKDPQRVIVYLEHMLKAIERINNYTDDMIELTFLENELVQDAVIRNIEILGEASKNIELYHPEFAADHFEIPWSDIYLMRNRVSHGYFSVDFEIIWQTIQKDLPELEIEIKKMYKNLQ